jgi:hypothetical protein
VATSRLGGQEPFEGVAREPLPAAKALAAYGLERESELVESWLTEKAE